MKLKILTIAIVLLILVGIYIPFGSFTSTGGCPRVTDTIPTIRLHLIKGQTLKERKQLDQLPDPVNAGCTIDTKFVQYLL